MRGGKILLVDDDGKMGALVAEYLAQFGFAVSLQTRPSAGLAALADSDFDAAIFDVMLPEMDGFELCKRARAQYPQLPILMLTARGDLTDRVVGLEIGADDYLPKPFEPRELSARLSALLRRARRPQHGKALRFRGIEIHLAERRVYLGEENTRREVVLSAAEFRVLAELARRHPEVVSRDFLIEKIRGFEPDVFDRSVDIAISRLRAKLQDPPAHPQFIQTVRGAGYAFIAPPQNGAP